MTAHGLIPDEWLLSYAAGALGEAHALVVASHVESHEELRRKVADAEAIGGALIEDIKPAEISVSMFDDLLSQLDGSVPQEEAPQKSFPHMPNVLAEYIGKPLDNLKWRIMGPGLRQVRLWDGENGEKLWLLKARGGTTMPSHDHRGSEMTLVLKGSYHVGTAHYTLGLIELADQDTLNHEPVIDEGEECICLVVTEAPIKIHNWIGRMVQPFIGL